MINGYKIKENSVTSKTFVFLISSDSNAECVMLVTFPYRKDKQRIRRQLGFHRQILIRKKKVWFVVVSKE